MKLIPEQSSIYLHREPVDFRKAINGLVIIVEQQMELSPFEDAMFLFSNKARDKIKVLYWDKTGFCLWYKRLEKERFKWPLKAEQKVLTLSAEQWRWLLSGIDIIGHQPLNYHAVA